MKDVDLLFSLSRRIRHLLGTYALSRWLRGDHTWFDHRIDELRWPENIFWVERGVVARQHLPQDGRLLDLCCGDGYYSDVFWSTTAGLIDAVDRDPEALRLARTAHAKPNIRFHQLDIVRDPLPGSGYAVVCFFEALEHLSVDDGMLVLEKIKAALAPDGWLVGSTPQVAPEARGQGNREHDNEFESPESLEAFVGLVFSRVETFASFHPGRTTLYFRARA